MAEDWRVTATLDDGFGASALGWLHEHEVEDDARERLGQRVAVSADHDQVFLYADTRPAAEQAERVLERLLHDRGVDASFDLARWHPVEEEWEQADAALPHTAAERRAEREKLDEEETAESQASGYAEWEVRLDLPSHREALRLTEQLKQEGFTLTRRWKYLLVGANNRDEARELATRLQREAPAGTRLHVEPGGEMVWEVAPKNPFAVLGGLGA
jgi:hypothetical protein